MDAKAWRLTLAAAALMALVVGTRSAFGLIVSPLNTATGAGLASLSLALALGQLAVGFTQPLVGAVSDRFGAARVVVVGAMLLAITTGCPPPGRWPAWRCPRWWPAQWPPARWPAMGCWSAK